MFYNIVSKETVENLLSCESVEGFIVLVKQLDNPDDKHYYAIDTIFEIFDEAYLADKFDYVDNILSQIVVSEYTESTIVAFLTAAMWARNHLRNRNDFIDRVCEHFKDDDDKDGLLSGLIDKVV